MAKNTGKVREKSGNFVSPEKWEPCFSQRRVQKSFYHPTVCLSNYRCLHYTLDILFLHVQNISKLRLGTKSMSVTIRNAQEM